MECHGDRRPGRYINTGRQDHDVSYDEAREGASRAWRRPADCGMPADGVSFQKNAGYEDGDTDDVFPRQAAESNALLFSLDQPMVGYMVKSMRLIPTNTVGQACDRVRLRRIPREACYDQE